MENRKREKGKEKRGKRIPFVKKKKGRDWEKKKKKPRKRWSFAEILHLSESGDLLFGQRKRRRQIWKGAKEGGRW